MTNHPNRATRMHSFSVEADRDTGEWDLSTAAYLGHVIRSEHHAMADTADRHYDQHDGETLHAAFWAAADGVSPVSSNVAITVIWK